MGQRVAWRVGHWSRWMFLLVEWLAVWKIVWQWLGLPDGHLYLWPTVLERLLTLKTLRTIWCWETRRRMRSVGLGSAQLVKVEAGVAGSRQVPECDRSVALRRDGTTCC